MPKIKNGDKTTESFPLISNNSTIIYHNQNLFKGQTKIIATTGKISANNSQSIHKLQSLSKFHYHLKTDQVYGDKKLKLCGTCLMPANLTQDLQQLNRLIKKSSQQTTNGNEAIFLKKINNQNGLNKLKVIGGSESDTRLEFDVLDLSTDRASSMNLPIINLPNDLFCFTQLIRLHLDGNQIKTLPDLLCEKLINLEVLTLSSNNLKILPKSMQNLKKLRSLHLACNKFEQFPEAVCSLVSLKFLDLCSNRLVSVSNKLPKLNNLESLLLFDNLIVHVPDSIGSLVSLRSLWLGKNNLQKLPASILNLKSLDWGEFNLSCNFNGNPLSEPPYDVCAQGISVIRHYFESKKCFSVEADIL